MMRNLSSIKNTTILFALGFVFLSAPCEANSQNMCVLEFDSDPGRYPQGIREYQKKHPKSRINSRALIEEHLRLALDHYTTHLAGSLVKIYDNAPSINHKTLLSTQLTQPGFGSIHYHLSPKPYEYKQDEAYVDFAAKEIMGGVFSGGFVQEEMMMLTSNFMPVGAAIRARPYKGPNFCRNVSLKNLDTEPAILRLRQFLYLDQGDEIYGRKLHKIKPFDAKKYLKIRQHPVDIYVIAIAAKSYRPDQRYSYKDIQAMTVALTRAFYQAMMAQHNDGKRIVIHTGNWGSGAFGNSQLTVWAMQRVAIEAAYSQLVKQTGLTPQIDFYYDAYNQAGVSSANEAQDWVSRSLGRTFTLEEAVQLIFAKTQTDQRWNVRRK